MNDRSGGDTASRDEGGDPDPDPDRSASESDVDDDFVISRHARGPNSSHRLEAYMARTQTALDLFAMLTLWLVLVPVVDFRPGGLRFLALGARVATSVVFAVDMGIRARLAPHHLRYLRTHPIGLFAVIVPPIRVLFSIRLIRGLFRRGNLGQFLLAAALLLLNGALIVYFVERSARGANIDTLGDSLWWSIVTVTTVGYGDLYPVTTYGRVVAAFLMSIGVLTLAVITANVSSNFNEQARRRRQTTMVGVSVENLRELRDRIDVLLGEHESATTAGGSAPQRPGSGDDAPE